MHAIMWRVAAAVSPRRAPAKPWRASATAAYAPPTAAYPSRSPVAS